MKNKNLISFSSIAITTILLSCNNAGTNTERHLAAPEYVKTESSVSLTPEQAKSAALVIGKIEQRTISSKLRVNGKIDVPPQNMISVSVPMGGYLKQTNLLPGTQVRRGQVLAVMEDQQYIQLQQDYLMAKNHLALSTKEFERQKELNQSKASSDKIFQQAEADFTSAKINVKALSERLKLIGIDPDKLSAENISRSINIYSPIDGYVSEVLVNIGKYTQPSEMLFELINPTDIHLALTIFEKDLNKISIGQKVFAYTNNHPGKKHECEIILIGKNLSLDRSTEVHSHFEKYDKSLVPGMYMNAEIELSNLKVLALPEEAIVRFENKQYIFVQDKENEFTMTEVKTGNRESGFTEIVSGENLSDKNIVLKGAYTLLMKMKNTEEE
jgi:membrane fusion protein, heavy metal efflux system